MPQVKLDSVDAIKQFRAAFIKFAEAVNSALGNAESDVARTENWLEGEAKNYWQSEIRKAQTKLAAAQEALRMKTLYKNLDGTTPSAVDERKAVAVAKARLDHCTRKLESVRRFSNLLQRESVLYKGSTQRFSTTIQAGTPRGLAFLDRVMNAIDQYVNTNPQVASLPTGAGQENAGRPGYLDFLAPITRAEPDAEKKEDAATEAADSGADKNEESATTVAASDQTTSDQNAAPSTPNPATIKPADAEEHP